MWAARTFESILAGAETHITPPTTTFSDAFAMGIILVSVNM
jgi:hypothetical protein